MRLENKPSRQIAKEILGIIGRYLDLNDYKVFFFGSRVEGRGDEYSDIDVGIEGPQRVPLEVMERIKEECSNLQTLYTIDIVDFSRVSSHFLKTVQKKEYLN